MKTLILFLATLLITVSVNAQTTTAYNPILQNLHFTPEPNVFGFQNCSEAIAEFDLGMTTQANATQFATAPLKVNICLQGFLPANMNPVFTVFGSHAQYFTWSYDIFTNCIQGVQSSTLYGTGSDIFNMDPRAFGKIGVRLEIAEYLPVPTTISFDATLDVPAYMQVGNVPDEHEYVQTQNYIGVTSLEGTLFVDANNSGTPTGIGNGMPGSTQMYVNVTDDLSGLVEDNAVINSNGTYSIDSLRPDRNYSITISTVQGVNGQTPPVASVPSNWNFSSEDCCDNLSNDGLADGTLSVWVSKCAITNSNFAISAPIAINSAENSGFSIPLAINDLNFQITEKDCSTLLTWNHSIKNNYQRYDVMRKEVSASSFTKLGTINVQPNTADEYQYSFVSKNEDQENKLYQYRLRLTDMNEEFFASRTRTFSLNCNDNIAIASLYPNPAKNNINLLFDNSQTSETIKVTIIDVAGKTLLNETREILEGQNNIQFDISSLPSGYYMLQYADADMLESGTLKFIIK